MRTDMAAKRRDEALKRGDETMVFDWDKAARLIKESGAKSAEAGLRDDWEWTGGYIFFDGEPIKEEKDDFPVETYAYLASCWAVPEIRIDGGEKQPCYKMHHEALKWDAKTRWPKSALKILQEETK